MANGVVWLSLLLLSCGTGSDNGLVQFDSNGTYAVTVTREGDHPVYRCQGTVQMQSRIADFACEAEGLAPWALHGPVEHFPLPDVVRLWIRRTDPPALSGQPDIALDLFPDEDKFTGWGTVILRGAGEAGHPGADAEARKIED